MGNSDYAQNTAHLYNRIADWYVESFWDDETDSDWLEKCMEAFGPRALVADVGSGPGNYASRLLRRACEVICLDISPAMILAARVRLPKADGVVADMRALPLGSASVESVLCAYSLNHIARHDLDGTLDEFARILRKNGTIALMLKTGDGCYQFTSAKGSDTRGLMCLYKLEDLRPKLESRGVSICKVEEKSDVSPHEFRHAKMLILGRKRA